MPVCSVTQSCPTLCDPIDCSCQAPLLMGCPRQGCWSGLPFPSPGDLFNPGTERASLACPELQADFLPLHHWGSPVCVYAHTHTYLPSLVTQSCLTLWNPMDSSPPGSSVQGDSPGKNTGVGCHALLQGIFPIQGSNPGLPHCRWILYCLSHQGSPRKMGSLSLFQGLFPTQESNWNLLHCR